MLSNIVLNEMDQELERRGLKYARWADDFVILLKSRRAAERAMESITRYLEEVLGLPVNREKSEVARVQEVTFLGFWIYRNRIQVSKESLKKFKRRVKELTRRNNPLSMYQAIRELNVNLVVDRGAAYLAGTSLAIQLSLFTILSIAYEPK